MNEFTLGEPVTVAKDNPHVPDQYRGLRGLIASVIDPTAPDYQVTYAVDLVGAERPIVMPEAWLEARTR